MASTMLHEKCCNTVLRIGAPLLTVGVGAALLVSHQSKASILGSAPEAHENNKKQRSEKVPNGHKTFHCSSNRPYTME